MPQCAAGALPDSARQPFLQHLQGMCAVAAAGTFSRFLIIYKRSPKHRVDVCKYCFQQAVLSDKKTFNQIGITSFTNLLFSVSDPPADSEDSLSIWGRAPSTGWGTTLHPDSHWTRSIVVCYRDTIFTLLCVALCPGRGERGGAAGVRSLPAGRAGASFSAGLQRQVAAPPEAETRPGAAQSATGAARHLPAGTEEALQAIVFIHRLGKTGNTVMFYSCDVISDMLFNVSPHLQHSFECVDSIIFCQVLRVLDFTIHFSCHTLLAKAK